MKVWGKREPVVLFDAGGRYADNPRAISEALMGTGFAGTVVWRANRSAVLPSGVVRVARWRHYLWWFRRASVFVASDGLLPATKRPGTRYVQTWHGTPLKRIAFDVEDPSYPDAATTLRALARDVENWDMLISPNAHSTSVFRRAFRYDGPIAEIGHPRNDRLVKAGAADRLATRRLLGVPEDKRLVLYAPTWRDRADPLLIQRLARDLEAWVDRAPAGDLLLIRAHPLDHVLGADETFGGRAINVSRWPDIADLLVVADVLVTDYSSTMFDFAVTGRPMVFFAYDLRSYREDGRGLYLPFEGHVPGPIVDNVDALLAELHREAPPPASSERYRRFVETYCSHEDGNAAVRACSLLLDQANAPVTSTR